MKRFRIGMTMEQALNRMYERMPLQEVNFFGIVLLIQQKNRWQLGGSAGQPFWRFALAQIYGREDQSAFIRSKSVGLYYRVIAVSCRRCRSTILTRLFDTTLHDPNRQFCFACLRYVDGHGHSGDAQHDQD